MTDSMDVDFPPQLWDECMVEDVWITRNGRMIPVPQMVDDHLQNTIRYLRRKVLREYSLRAVWSTWMLPWTGNWRTRLQLRSRATLLGVASHFGRRPEVVFPILARMLEELEHRGLEEKPLEAE